MPDDSSMLFRPFGTAVVPSSERNPSASLCEIAKAEAPAGELATFAVRTAETR